MTQINASFDKILCEFPALSDSYIPPKRIGDYKRIDYKVDSPDTKLYMPSSYCWKYENSIGNKMEIILYYFKYGQRRDMYKVQMHSEAEPLTLKEVEETTYTIYEQYIRYTGRRATPEPYPSVVEIALDHTDCDTYYHYYANQNHLYKKNCRKRIEFTGDDKQENAEGDMDKQDNKDKSENSSFRIKGKRDKRYILYAELPTYYLGSFGSSVFARCYLMFPIVGGDPVYRLEPVFQRNYFERIGVRTLRDLYFVDFNKAWQDNFTFVRLNWDKIFKVTDGSSVAKVVRGLQPTTQSFIYNLTDTQFPTELDVYDMLKMIPQKDIDWWGIYNQLHPIVQAEFLKLWTTPKKYANPNKRPRMRKPQEIFRDLHLEQFVGIKYQDIKERLFYDPFEQILQEASEFDEYNGIIIKAINNLVKNEPLQYRIQKSLDRVNDTEHVNNISEIARLAHTATKQIRKYMKGGASQN